MEASADPSISDAPAGKPSVLEFYREDTPGMARALVIAAAMISVGGLCTLMGALSQRLGVPAACKPILGTIGALILFVGLIRGFVLFPSVLWRERTLAVEREGVRFTWHDQDPEFYTWGEVNVFEGTAGALLLRFTDGSVRAYSGRFGGKEFTELARCLESCRRKAQFALL